MTIDKELIEDAVEVGLLHIPESQKDKPLEGPTVGTMQRLEKLCQIQRAREAAKYEARVKELEANAVRQEATPWKDVANELPKEAQEVLFVRAGKVLHGAWIGGIFWHSNTKMAAAYWMPLPAAPTIERTKP